MNNSYLSSIKNAVLLSKASKAFRLLMMNVWFDSLRQKFQFKSLSFSTLFCIISLLMGSLSWGQISLSGGAIATGVSTNTTTSATLTITKPSGLAIGDIMIVQVVQSGNNTTTAIGDATSLGWTEIAGSSIRTGNGNYSRATLLYKIATSTDVAATNFSFTLDGNSDDGEGGITAFTGVDNTNPFDVTPGAAYTNIANDQTLNATAITTTTANSAIIMFGVVHDNVNLSAWTTVNPVNLTELYDVDFNANVDIGMGAAWATKPTIGATGAASAAISGGNNINNGSILIALRSCTASPTIITSGTVSSVCFSTSAQTAILPYTATTNSPTSYSIDWDDTANAAGLEDQTSTFHTFLSGAGNTPNIAIPASLASATYDGTLTIRTSGGCRNTQAISVTVNPINTFGAASSTPTICIGSALPVAITHTTTGATGIGSATDLPTGVSVSWALNTITISGTPTESGTFNYSIPLTGGCGSVNATGTITVNGLPTATAGGTQTICSNGSATVSGATSSNGTIAWTENGAGSITSGATTLTPTYTAAAGDAGNTVTLTMTVSNSPCSAATASSTVTVNPTTVGGSVTGGTTICSGLTSGLLTLGSATGAVQRWESSISPFTVWSTIANTASTYTSGTLTQTTQFRAVVKSGACLEANSTPTTVTITPTVGTPSTPSPGASTICQANSPTAYTTSATNATSYTWSVTGSGNTISGNGTTGTVTWASGFTGSATISVVANGCNGPSPLASTTVTVTPTVGTPSTPSPGASTICQASSPTAYTTSATNATSYTWSVAGSGNTISGTGTTGTVTWASGFTGSATVSVVANGCNGPSASASTTVTVNPTTVGGSVTGGTTICSGLTSGLLTLGSATGAVQRWESSVSPFTVWSTIANTASTYTSGTLTQTTQFRAVVKSGACLEANSTSTTVTVTPTVGTPSTPSSGASTICQASTPTAYTTLATNATSYTWSVSGSGNTISGTGTTGTVTWAAGFTGSATVSVVANGCNGPSASASTTVTVNPTTVGGSVTGGTTICSGLTSGLLTLGSTIGVVQRWEASVSPFTVWSTIANTASTYTSGTLTQTTQFRAVVKSGACLEANSATTTVTVIPTVGTPSTPSPGASTICQASSPTAYTTSATNATSYTWSITGSGNAISGTGTTGTVTWASGFTGSATVSVRANGCNGPSSLASTTVTVTPTVGTPSTPSPGASTICQASSPTAYTTSATNATSYTWSVSGSGNTISGTGTTGTVTWAAGFTGSATVSVVANGCNGPSASASTTVTVNPTTVGGSITGGTTICSGLTSGLLTLGSATGAVQRWESSVSPFTVWSTIANTASTYTSGTLTQTTQFRAVVKSGACLEANSTSTTVTITPTVGTPSTPSSGASTICQASTPTAYTTLATNATSYTWSVSGSGNTISGTGTTGTVTWAAGFTGSATVSVVANGCNGPSFLASTTVTVTPTVGVPTAITIASGTEPTCQLTNATTTTTYSTTVPNNTGFNWSLSNATAGSINANTGVMTWTNGFFGTVNIQVTANGCNGPSSQVVRTILVNPLPAAAGVINGPAVVCQGQANIIYSVPVIANATTYTWTLPTGATIASGSDTNTIYVNFSMTASSGNITVQGTNSCGNGVISANYAIAVNITASITANYSPTICSGEQVTVSPANGGGNIVPAGTTYSWGLPAVTGGITGATALSGQTGFVQTLVNTTNVEQTASYNVTATTGGCSASTFSIVVKVNPKPTVSGTPVNQPICSGGAIAPITFSDPNGIAGTIDYNWTRNNTSNVNGMADSGSGALLTGNLSNATNSIQTTVFTVIATTQNGCASLPFTVSVAVNPIPTLAATPSANQTICSENNITPIALSTLNGVAGTTYSWTRTNTSNITGIPDGSGTSITGSLTNTTNTVQTTVFTIKATANGCDSSTTTVSVTVNPKPTFSVSSATQTVCGGSPINDIVLTPSNNVAGTTYTWTRDNSNVSGIIAAGSTGTGATISGNLVNNTNSNQVVIFTITATAGGCASTTTTSTITVKPTPTFAISISAQIICSANAIAAIAISNPNNVAGTTYTWSRNNTTFVTGIADSGSSNSLFSISGTLTNNQTTTQTTTFTITATANGCSRSSTATVTVYAPLVAPVISASQDICIGQTPSAFYMSTPVSGGSGSYTYQWQVRTRNCIFGFCGGWNSWSNAGTNSTYQSGATGFTTQYEYRLVVTDIYCTTQSVISNVITISTTGIGGSVDGASITGAPTSAVCNGVITPIVATLDHANTSQVKFYWSTNNSFVTPVSGGPEGVTTSGSFSNGTNRRTRHTFNFTAANNTNATQTTVITISPEFQNNFGVCNSTPTTINLQIRPTATATATVPSATICNVSSAGIVAKGNITDAATTFGWTRSGNASVISTQASGTSPAIAAGGTFTIPDILTNNTTTAQPVTYTITPTSNSCTGTPISVTITVAPTVTAGTVAANQTICSGDDPVAFTQTVAATGLNLTYQWQSSTDNSTFSNISGATASTYDAPSGLVVNTWYRRVATSTSSGTTPPVSAGVTYTANSANCFQNSAAVSVTINAINPGSVAGAQTICSGDDPVAFTSEAGTGGGVITYQWESSILDCNTGFGNIAVNGTSAIYDIPSGLTLTTYYRRKAISTLNGKACLDYSNCITVLVNSVTAGTVGSDQTICGNNPDAFTVMTAATGLGILSYQWQSNTTGCGGSWGDILGATAATYDAPPGLLVTTYYRRIVTSTLNGKSCFVNGNCITVTANSVTAGSISGNRTICSGGDPEGFTETTPATGTGITYQWQYSLVGGAGPWTDVSGATSATYDAPGPITQNTYYQRVVKASANATDCYAYSGFVVVFVNNVTASVIDGDQTLCSTVDPAAFTVVTPATGTVTPTYQWQSNTSGCGGPWTSILSATNATYDPPVITQTMYYRVLATSTLNGESCSAPSNCITVISLSKSWNGSISTDWNTPANWSPAGIPDATNCVIIPDVTNDPIISGTNYTAFAYSLTVLNKGQLSVTALTDNTIIVTDRVDVDTKGFLTFEDTASLVQINNVTNNGNITYNRQTTKITKMDYTYWSAPVLPFTLGGVSPKTSGDKMYSFDSNIDDWKQESPATSMVPGVGYIIRGPQNYVFPRPPSTWEAPFVGVPNNGLYSITGIIADRSYLLGNPYPSALDANSFLDANQNVLDGTLYFWTHNTPIAIGPPDPGSGLYAYSGNDYASYNRTGGVGTAQAPTSIPGINNDNIPSGKIASGQGFFGGSKTVQAGFVSGTPIVYNNTMRVGVGGITGNNSQFYKTKNLKTTKASEKNRIWLDLTNPQGAFKQTLVGYVTDATNDYEGRFDGESYDGNDFLDFYSILQDKNLTIQGRALPFDENDEIPLGYRVAEEGTFSISIDQTDGLLSNQPVFIEDKITNRVFHLKDGKYTFSTAAGTFNNRFVLRYRDKTLSTEEPEVADGIAVFYSNNYKTLIIRNNVKEATVNSVTLYNMIGQKMAYWDVKGREQTSIQIPIKNLPSEIYIVKVKTTKGESNKKIIIR